MDTEAPDTTTDLGPEGAVSASTTRFEFSSERGIYGAFGFRYWLNDGGSSQVPAGDLSSGFAEFGDLSLGEHTLYVEATDWAGNVGPVQAHTFMVRPEQVNTSVSAGDAVTTDSENNGATASDPVETRVLSPAGGTVPITETPTTTTQPPSGYSLLNQQTDIEAPASTADNPLVFEFVLDTVPYYPRTRATATCRSSGTARRCRTASTEPLASPPRIRAFCPGSCWQTMM